MKQCVKFPEDKFLAVRSCLVAICMGNRPAANLLSILLFRYNLRMENKDDAENQNAVKATKGESPDQDTSVRIFRTQAQLVEDMCGEITEKTLHDTAVPMLQLLGFLDLEEHMIANCYILHIDLVQHALNLYLPGRKEQPQLEKFLISTMQLEKFMITSAELEKFLINKKNFQLGLEKVLIQNRNISNQQRGRKLRADVPLRGKRRLPKNLKEDSKKEYKEERAEDAHALSLSETESHSYRHEPTQPHPAWNCENWCRAHDGTCADYQAWIERGGRDEPTDPRIPAIARGVHDGNTAQFDHHHHGPANDPPGLQSQRNVPDSAEHQYTPADLRGHPTQIEQQTLARAGIPGEPDSPPSAQNPHASPGTDGAATRAKAGEPRASDGVVTQESILADWEAIQGRPQAWTDRHRKAAREGVAARPTQDELRGCRDWLPKTDNPKRPWYRLHGVELWDVIEKLGAYRSYLALSIEPAPLADIKQPGPMDIYTQNSLNKEKMKRRGEEMIAKAKGLQVHGTQ